ncbi:GNAT family N-acetyltransferase [Paracoccus sp. (in: a-proteobacteria)]|uniref:GNAT family N-acetyltransferase n=1 Tax=Paracoccus sp. TaxID=267 RepID=UPI0026E0DC82|nr:GNAT family N-acetyltransferase [Paracoccus sp. (in: a-proteobacteria)]MDO5646635.1 GNAT family N-acetyltransferase [Paracoccus sp. (in: a-proteobacteria)]
MIELTTFRASDAADIAAGLGHWDVVKWLTAVPWPYDAEQAARFIRDLAGPDEYAIRRNGRVIGTVRAGETLGYWVAPDWQGQGVGYRAAVLALSRRFWRDPSPIRADYLQGNDRSARLLARLGFRETARGVAFCAARQADVPAVVTELTADDFAARHPISLTTPRLSIGAMTTDDLPHLHRVVTHPHVAPMLLRFRTDMPPDSTAAILTEGASLPPIRLALRRDGRAIGMIGVSAGDPMRLYYALSPDHAGHGLMTEAARAMLAEIRLRFAPPRIAAETFDDNPASAAILARLGFRAVDRSAMVSMARECAAPATIWHLTF